MRGFPFAAAIAALALGCSEAGRPPASATVSPTGEGPQSHQQKAAPTETSRRKIIYNAGIDLLVDNLTEASAKLDNLVKDHRGLVAQSDVNTNPHFPRSGTWRVRIPVDGFGDFVRQVAQLGEALKDKVDSQDITEKYFDYQVRIDNKKVQVDRLQKIIREQTGKISELLEAERELARVTTELEELKGAVTLWDNQVALATVDVTMSERRQSIAPAPPSFAQSVSRTFSDSLGNLVSFLQAVALVVVALVPWTPVIVLFGGGLWLVLRRTVQRSSLGRQRGKSAV
jgi:hypothetical protein